jgi:hypothetical protein
MTDQTKSEQGATPVSAPHAAPAAPAVPSSDAATLQMLVTLLLAERQQALEERQEKQKSLKARDDQRKITARYAESEKLSIQAMCTHKKGGLGVQSPKTDYAVYYHTYTDATCCIRCQICGAKWRQMDTPEWLFRKGEKVPNHTKIGWKDAFDMLKNSTNTASASEVKMSTQPIVVDIAGLD